MEAFSLDCGIRSLKQRTVASVFFLTNEFLFAEMSPEFSGGAGSCLKQGTGDAGCCNSSLRIWVLSQGCIYVGFSLDILGSGLPPTSELSRAQFKHSLEGRKGCNTTVFLLNCINLFGWKLSSLDASLAVLLLLPTHFLSSSLNHLLSY